MNTFFDTGSTLLNLAISDSAFGGIKGGTMINVIGDSSSGKSFLALTTLACCVYQNPKAKPIYDDAEGADSFNKELLFGAKAAKKIVNPYIKLKNKKVTNNSALFEDFEMNVVQALEDGQCVYVLDSFDSLSDKAEQQFAKTKRDAIKAGKESKGSYGMSKPKAASAFFREIVNTSLKKTKSVLMIISQTRDDINPMTFTKKTRSGGRALKFYSSIELWIANGGKIQKTINGKTITIGVKAKLQVKKNKITGKYREVAFDIYYDYGIDDIGSCIDYLIAMKVWKKNKNTILAPNIKFKGTRQKLVEYIERNRYDKLRKLVQRTWNEFEKKATIKRRPRFGDE